MSKIDTFSFVSFVVEGIPRPKQSFRYGSKGKYTPAITKEWAGIVRDVAYKAMGTHEPLDCQLDVAIEFYLPDKRKRDLDNLSKNVLDAMNGIVYTDDRIIVNLLLSKWVDRDNPRAVIHVFKHKNGEVSQD